MRIVNIRIKNFRSIEDVDIEINKLNILVGQNNHGKTNFLSAVNWFFTGGSVEQHKRKGSSELPYVQVTFDDVQGALSKMKNEKNQKTLSSKLPEADTVTVARISDKGGKSVRQILNEDGNLIDPGTGFDRALNDFLPNLEFVQTENSLRDVLKYGKTTQIGTMLSGVLNEILASGDEKYKNFIDEFLQTWSKAKQKYYILDKLAEKGIPIYELADQFDSDIDMFDIVMNIAYGQKTTTRKTRAEKARHSRFINQYQGKAREVLEALIDKYESASLKAIEARDILKVQPLDQLGTPLEIASFFGGADGYNEAVSQLTNELYEVVQ